MIKNETWRDRYSFMSGVGSIISDISSVSLTVPCLNRPPLEVATPLYTPYVLYTILMFLVTGFWYGKLLQLWLRRFLKSLILSIYYKCSRKYWVFF